MQNNGFNHDRNNISNGGFNMNGFNGFGSTRNTNNGGFNMTNTTRTNRYHNLDVSNPAPRCPVVLLLDTSSSMEGAPIRELRAGVRQFLQETSGDEAASRSVELEVITFDNDARAILPFTPIVNARISDSALQANGMTSMGAALELAYRDLADRRRMYRDNGISAYRPWVILMTDGGPNDDWEDKYQKLQQLGDAGKVQYLGIGIGDDADFDTLRMILPAQPGPVKLRELRFKAFFRWLTDSMKSVSRSAVSAQDSIQFGGIDDWADL